MRDVRSDVPPVLVDVVARAVAKDPGERFRDGVQLATALGALGCARRPRERRRREHALRGASSRRAAADGTSKRVLPPASLTGTPSAPRRGPKRSRELYASRKRSPGSFATARATEVLTSARRIAL